MPGAVALRRVPGVRRRRGRGGGVARGDAGAAVRLPARRRARHLARALARPEVPVSRSRERLPGCIPHRLQQMAPRVPTAVLNISTLVIITKLNSITSRVLATLDHTQWVMSSVASFSDLIRI